MSDDDAHAPAEDRRRESLVRALGRYAARLERKLEALRGDLAEAERAAEFRRAAEALLAYAHQVPARAGEVTLPDPADPARTLAIALEPRHGAAANAARYFRRAARAERGRREIPPRLAAVAAERDALRARLASLSSATDDAARDGALLELERELFRLGRTVREQIRAPDPLPRRTLGLAAEPPARPRASPTTPARAPLRRDATPGRLQPWRFRTREGWDVLIGRTSEGNDHLTLHLARPEDYWFHAHGCPGSHVVLRRGRGPNEPSRATLEEVASWAAYHSKARTAGKVPVHWTLKKYVRKPRGSKPGLVTIERERAIFVRPAEPPKEQRADVADAADAADAADTAEE
ncbi:MAG TPA: NFACT RNA binding domain-containing protein [Candidatus Acidoferrales bacterium]|nr:NFACT RNA binding domain-containing protein [Candidatus Acidoferrales bacterium]